jgi:VCBS repeat-containing protein
MARCTISRTPAIAPAFSERTGAANPFDGIDVDVLSKPSFADLDGDGDLDAIVGEYNGTLHYFLNTGAGFTQVVNVTAENDAAVLSADVRNLTETNAAADISSSGTLTISDPDSPATFVAQAGAVGLYGTFAINSAGAWTYTASSAHNEFVAGTTYTDTFSVASADGTPTSVTIHILGTDDPPVAQGDAYTLAVDAPLNVAAPGVLANDGADPEGNALSAHLVAGPTHAGSFIFNADGSFEYMPEPTFFGDDTFTYRTSAGGLNSARPPTRMATRPPRLRLRR